MPSSIIDIDSSQITPEFFEQKCLCDNIPCIIRNCNEDHHDDNNEKQSSSLDTKFLRQALAFTEFCCCSDDEKMKHQEIVNENLFPLIPKEILLDENLRKEISETEVNVEVSFRNYEVMKLKDFFSKNQGLLLQLVDENPTTETITIKSSSWYLKDWHFAEFFEQHVLKKNQPNNDNNKTSPSSLLLYRLPSFMRKFAQYDVLQQFQASSSSSSSSSSSLPLKYGAGSHEYRFVYAGGCGSATLPHFDVCATYSWSLNLSGTKVWKFFSSNEMNEKMLTEYFLGPDSSLKQHLMKEEGKFDHLEDLLVRATKKEDIEEKEEESTTIFDQEQIITTITQNPGDIIFVPALWIHEVRNVSENFPCVSVNHNWYALPYSIPHILRLLSVEAKTALKMIGEESVAVLKSGGDENPKQSKRNPEWEMIFNLTLQGSSNWSLSVVRKFFEFCLHSRRQEEEDEISEKTTKNALSEALLVLEKLENEILD